MAASLNTLTSSATAGLLVKGGCSSNTVIDMWSFASGACTRGPEAGKMERLPRAASWTRPRPADPEEVGVCLLDACGDRAVLAGTELVFQVQHLFDATPRHDLTRADGDELHRGKLARHDADRLRWRARRDEAVEDGVHERPLGIEGHALHREDLLVSLGDGHGRQVRPGRERADDQIDLVDGDHALVQGPRHFGFGACERRLATRAGRSGPASRRSGWEVPTAPPPESPEARRGSPARRRAGPGAVA